MEKVLINGVMVQFLQVNFIKIKKNQVGSLLQMVKLFKRLNLDLILFLYISIYYKIINILFFNFIKKYFEMIDQETYE